MTTNLNEAATDAVDRTAQEILDVFRKQADGRWKVVADFGI
jgi:ketosteroid isomerase-like protein